MVKAKVLTSILLTLITFVVNSVFLTLYFSALMLDSLSKLTIHVDAVKIALPGTIILSVFVFLTPIMPRLMSLGPLSSSIDIGVSVAAVIWVVLTRRYSKTSWLGAILISAGAAIICIFVIFFVYILLLLLE